MKYLYAAKSQSFNVDILLKKDFVMASRNKDVNSCKYYHLFIFERRLKNEEVKKYELEYIGGFNYEF